MKAFYSMLLISILISCKSADHENKILKTSNPDSKEYKTELIRVLKTDQSKDFTYTFQQYKIVGDQEFIIVDIKGSNLNAESTLLVSNWDNISGIKTTKGIGYSGSELKNVKIGIPSDSEAPFKLEQVEGLID
jgi:hypothetical protein